MVQETSLGAAMKAAVQTLSRSKQTAMIGEYVYGKYPVFSRFKPLAIGIDQDLIIALPQHDPALILRFLSNHCRRPRYIKSLARGGKRFDLNNKPKGTVTPQEQEVARNHPCMQPKADAPADSAEHTSADTPAQRADTAEIAAASAADVSVDTPAAE